MILSTGALRRRGVHGHAWPPVRWQADRRWPGVPVREPQTGSAPRGGPGVETEPAHPRRPALGWLCRPGADGAEAPVQHPGSGHPASGARGVTRRGRQVTLGPGGGRGVTVISGVAAVTVVVVGEAGCPWAPVGLISGVALTSQGQKTPMFPGLFVESTRYRPGPFASKVGSNRPPTISVMGAVTVTDTMASWA